MDPLESPTIDPGKRFPPSPAAALRLWKEILAAAAAAAALAVLATRASGAVAGALRRRGLLLATIAACVAWGALFLHDDAWIPGSAGYDASFHLDYVRYLLERRAIPFADEGWQMFQPPLYYALAAAVLGALGVPVGSIPANTALRVLGLAIGVVQLALVAASARELFPGQPRRQVLAVAVGAALPVMLYMHLFPGNEPLIAALASAAVYVALRLMRRDAPGRLLPALVGVLAGLAALAKATGLLAGAVVLGVLAGWAILGPAAARRRRAASVALALASMVATCGWYYLRVWQRFGTPFVGGWEARGQVGWWQDPGVRTVHDFLRFGRSLIAPPFSGYAGFWDGLHSTLWADGMVSGMASVAVQPPLWSATWMSASLLLALVPGAAILLGALALVRGWLRRPTAPAALLVGLSALVLAAMAAMAIRVPAAVAVKASYGLVAVVPLCAFAAIGLDTVMGGSRRRAVVGAALLGAWGVVSFLTYWIASSSQEARANRAVASLEAGDVEGGIGMLEDASRPPEAWTARLMLAGVLLDRRAPPGYVAARLASPEPAPESGEAHFVASRIALDAGDLPVARAEAEQAVRVEPESPAYRDHLAMLFSLSAADAPRAIAAWRELLAVDPFSPKAHLALARLYSAVGDSASADLHLANARALGAR